MDQTEILAKQPEGTYAWTRKLLNSIPSGQIGMLKRIVHERYDFGLRKTNAQ